MNTLQDRRGGLAPLDRSRRLLVHEMLGRSARTWPGKPALVFGGQRRTFRELDDRSSRVANALADRGVRRGDRVALLLHNGFEIVEAFFGCQKLGACPVPVNFRLAAGEITHILVDSGAAGMICAGELNEVAAAAARDVPGVGFALAAGDPAAGQEPYEAALGQASAEAPGVELDQDALAFLIYTSGTTGLPKGAMLTHQSLVVSAMSWVYEMQAGHEDVWLSGQPLFHIGGINGLLPFILLGATSILTPSTGFDPERAVGWLREHEVTKCIFVPTQWQEICAAWQAARPGPSALRTALWGASSAPRSTLELMAATFPGVDIVSAFGQTEMSGATTFLKGADSLRKMGSVGKPVLGVEVRIVDDEGLEVVPGDVGEIVYRGPTVMRGYLGNPEATEEAFAGGWFHSGDLVREDEEGFLYVVDRKKDMIISGGENIYPAELERALLAHPAVADVAVVGVPHPRWVETPVAVVVLAEGTQAGEAELVAHCRERLAGFKRPSAVVFAQSLPRNAAGKVLKRRLREELG